MLNSAISDTPATVFATDIPARLDRLRWGRFHTLVVVALGVMATLAITSGFMGADGSFWLTVGWAAVVMLAVNAFVVAARCSSTPKENR